MASGSAFWKGFQGAFGAGLFMTANNDRGGTAELAPQTFLLAPGGQDYVGDNSYDNVAFSIGLTACPQKQ